jgi:hypothetical protein
MTRGLSRSAGKIGSGVLRLVLGILIGGEVFAFWCGSATLVIASFALVPKESLLFCTTFFIDCHCQPSVGWLTSRR